MYGEGWSGKRYQVNHMDVKSKVQRKEGTAAGRNESSLRRCLCEGLHVCVVTQAATHSYQLQ